KEHDFNVEQDEKHRHEVKFHGQPRAAFPDGEHAAFISGILDGGPFALFAENHGQKQHPKSKANRQTHQHQHRYILSQLLVFHSSNVKSAAALASGIHVTQIAPVAFSACTNQRFVMKPRFREKITVRRPSLKMDSETAAPLIPPN